MGQTFQPDPFSRKSDVVRPVTNPRMCQKTDKPIPLSLTYRCDPRSTMELRNHACMSHGWVSIWPPDWKWIFGADNSHPVGEIGLLEEVQRSNIDPNACFLTMNHAGASYVGRLHFDREGYCGLLCDLLPHNYGQSLQEIGEIDIP